MDCLLTFELQSALVLDHEVPYTPLSKTCESLCGGSPGYP